MIYLVRAQLAYRNYDNEQRMNVSGTKCLKSDDLPASHPGLERIDDICCTLSSDPGSLFVWCHSLVFGLIIVPS